MGFLSPAVQLAMELVDSDSEDDEYDELVTKVALKLARQSRHRVPRYCEDVQRVATENAFGLLKQRFRRLYFVDANSVKQCCLIVMAACVLHNLCNDERDFFDELEDTTLDDEVGNDEADIMSDALAPAKH
ncbi:hypothetical protein HPB52_022847 [Rhipicephalus sanguineus]|uniref:DDE Tnp4 domain-containing protein n=1 Tax=Rhipicephalus sanguineus TaxID=34632 RepID=A0A9D4SWV0_RHISA|nr:hypothetical protein HPB52_022847 [Rhipicephalus sanguineus]